MSNFEAGITGIEDIMDGWKKINHDEIPDGYVWGYNFETQTFFGEVKFDKGAGVWLDRKSKINSGFNSSPTHWKKITT